MSWSPLNVLSDSSGLKLHLLWRVSSLVLYSVISSKLFIFNFSDYLQKNCISLSTSTLCLTIKSAPTSRSWGQALIRALRKRSRTQFYFCSIVSSNSAFLIRLWFNLLCCRSEKKLSIPVENSCLTSHPSLAISIWLMTFSSMLLAELSASKIPL